jgi:hypothetical protein
MYHIPSFQASIHTWKGNFSSQHSSAQLRFATNRLAVLLDQHGVVVIGPKDGFARV